jgi:hypothetical protein
MARHAVVIDGARSNEADLLQHTAARGVLRGCVRQKGLGRGVLAVSIHQCRSDLGGQALSPAVSSDGVSQFAVVAVIPESGAANQAPLMVG